MDSLFEKSCQDLYQKCGQVIQSNFNEQTFQRYISPSNNGFVWSAVYAYSKHHHLTIRPDDIWLAILTQLSFYVNANPEELRDYFVSHEGQKELRVNAGGSLHAFDFGVLAEEMTHQIATNINCPDLRAWMMSSFSTTTNSDIIVAAVLFMGTMQKYFSYGLRLTCGIPSVTLLGELSDWEGILACLDKLNDMGGKAYFFAEMLRPILKHIVLSFKRPFDAETILFWNKMITKRTQDSGRDYVSGWLDAFCFWNTEGHARQRSNSVLNGVNYPTINLSHVPNGFASVPVTVDENGKIHKCTIVAGFMGIEALPQVLDENQILILNKEQEGSKFRLSADTTDLTRLQAFTGWLIVGRELEPDYQLLYGYKDD